MMKNSDKGSPSLTGSTYASSNEANEEGIALTSSSNKSRGGYSSIQSYEDDYGNYKSVEEDSLSENNDGLQSCSWQIRKKVTHVGVLLNEKWIEFREWMEPYDLYCAVAILIVATTTERVTFKVMIDRMIPYKFILLEIIFIWSWAVFGLMTTLLQITTNQITEQMKTFPQEKVFVMAFFDTVQFFGVVYSGIGVSPTMTIILLHASTLFILLGSRFVFPNRHYGPYHHVGVVLISIAISLSIFKIVYYDYLFNHDDSRYFPTKSAVIYVLSCCLQGFSTLYKERALVDWAQPVNIYFLSSRLFLYQFVITLILSMLFYVYEGKLSTEDEIFVIVICHFIFSSPAIMGSANRIPSGLYYGWKCFLGRTPSDELRDDDMNPYYVECSHSMWLVMAYVFATLGVLISINVVLRINSRLVGKAICAAILVAFIVLWMYDIHFTSHQNNKYIFGGSVGSLDIISMGILLIGMEVYGRDPEPDVELITNYVQSPSSSVTPSRANSMEDVETKPFMQFQQLQRK
jgi:hypothetical protein